MGMRLGLAGGGIGTVGSPLVAGIFAFPGFAVPHGSMLASMEFALFGCSFAAAGVDFHGSANNKIILLFYILYFILLQ